MGFETLGRLRREQLEVRSVQAMVENSARGTAEVELVRSPLLPRIFTAWAIAFHFAKFHGHLLTVIRHGLASKYKTSMGNI